jgi:lipopolysaccharide exporter
MDKFPDRQQRGYGAKSAKNKTPIPPEIQSTPEKADIAPLKRTAGRGALWKLAGGGWSTLIRLGASTVLARVLFPRDFGIVGMALLVQALIKRIGTLGMGSGVIAKKNVTDDDLSTVFWTDAACQFFIFSIVFISSPFAATFFHATELTQVLRVTSFAFLVSIIGNVPNMLISKRLQFKAQVIINSIETIITSALAIYFSVFLNWSFWSLVFSSLIASAFSASAKAIYVRWLPSFHFNRESFRYMFRFGINGLGSSIAEYFHQNVDYFIVGRLLGPATLGLYEYAYRIPHMLHINFARPVSGVIFPTLSKVQTNDRHLVAGYAKAAQYLALITFPLLAGLMAVADPFVAVLWGEKWAAIVLPMRILCVVAAFRCVFGPLGALYMCKDRPDLPFKIKIFRSLFTFTLVAIFAHYWGFIGVAIGMLVSVLPAFFEVWLIGRLTNSGMLKLMKGLYGPLICSVLCGLAALLISKSLAIQGFSPLVRLLIAVPVGGSVYFLTAMLFFRKYIRNIIDDVAVVLKRKTVSP